jgi:hypothetical protein
MFCLQRYMQNYDEVELSALGMGKFSVKTLLCFLLSIVMNGFYIRFSSQDALTKVVFHFVNTL